MTWFLYLIECRNGSIYTGITTDVEARYAAHASGKGARYTRANPPLRLLASLAFADRSAAARAEYAMKQLSAAEKRAFCAAQAAAEAGRAMPGGDIPAPDRDDQVAAAAAPNCTPQIVLPSSRSR